MVTRAGVRDVDGCVPVIRQGEAGREKGEDQKEASEEFFHGNHLSFSLPPARKNRKEKSKMKMYSKINFPASVVNAREKSICVSTRNNEAAYMPKSQMIIGEPDQYGITEVLIPFWLFTSKAMSDLDVDNGVFIERVRK